MVIPQGMSYAKLAGLPNVWGLYGAFVPVLVYAGLGSSRQLVRSTLEFRRHNQSTGVAKHYRPSWCALWIACYWFMTPLTLTSCRY